VTFSSNQSGSSYRVDRPQEETQNSPPNWETESTLQAAAKWNLRFAAFLFKSQARGWKDAYQGYAT
jgi:hypothetical protein